MRVKTDHDMNQNCLDMHLFLISFYTSLNSSIYSVPYILAGPYTVMLNPYNNPFSVHNFFAMHGTFNFLYSISYALFHHNIQYRIKESKCPPKLIGEICNKVEFPTM